VAVGGEALGFIAVVFGLSATTGFPEINGGATPRLANLLFGCERGLGCSGGLFLVAC